MERGNNSIFPSPGIPGLLPTHNLLTETSHKPYSGPAHRVKPNLARVGHTRAERNRAQPSNAKLELSRTGPSRAGTSSTKPSRPAPSRARPRGHPSKNVNCFHPRGSKGKVKFEETGASGIAPHIYLYMYVKPHTYDYICSGARGVTPPPPQEGPPPL